MFKTIIVPIDLAHAEKGKAMIDVAAKLGGKGARIVLTNIVENVPTFVAAQLPGGLLEKSQEIARNELEGMAKAGAANAEVEVRVGHPASAILRVAEEKGADLIIVASHQPGMQDYLLGSTAARVVRHAQCSVLVMR